MNDAELEAHIATCGRMIETAMKLGQRELADAWRLDMEHSIAQRSPEQIARMEAQRGLSEPCYFTTQGEKDGQELRGRAA